MFSIAWYIGVTALVRAALEKICQKLPIAERIVVSICNVLVVGVCLMYFVYVGKVYEHPWAMNVLFVLGTAIGFSEMMPLKTPILGLTAYRWKLALTIVAAVIILIDIAPTRAGVVLDNAGAPSEFS